MRSFWFCNIFWMSLSSALSSLRGRISPCTPVVTPGHAHVADMVMVGGVATAESLSWQKKIWNRRICRTYSFRKEDRHRHTHMDHLASGSTTKLTECPSAK